MIILDTNVLSALMRDQPDRREQAFDGLLDEDPHGRILSFDAVAATEAACLAESRQRSGITVDIQDTQIAGIALAHRASIATRNRRHFDGLSAVVVNPWSEESAEGD